MIKHLILLKIQSLTDINVDLLQWSIDLFGKKVQVTQLKMKIFLINN